jgi:hypothetical protein
MHEGIRTPDPQRGACGRWPEHLRLLNHATGELVCGRCRSTNLCRYCAMLFAVETSEMLLLDAMEDAPTIYVVLTARERLTRSGCTEHLRHLRRSLRRTWPLVEWAVTVEFQRRDALHLNLIVKHVAVDQHDEFHTAIVALWCARVDALPIGQWSDAISNNEGVVRYITKHFMKESQAPALGWRGHRYSSTRGYLVRPASVMRIEARRSLRLKRKLHKGMSLDVAERELEADELIDWTMQKVPGMTLGADVLKRLNEDAHRPFRVAA